MAASTADPTFEEYRRWCQSQQHFRSATQQSSVLSWSASTAPGTGATQSLEHTVTPAARKPLKANATLRCGTPAQRLARQASNLRHLTGTAAPNADQILPIRPIRTIRSAPRSCMTGEQLDQGSCLWMEDTIAEDV